MVVKLNFNAMKAKVVYVSENKINVIVSVEKIVGPFVQEISGWTKVNARKFAKVGQTFEVKDARTEKSGDFTRIYFEV